MSAGSEDKFLKLGIDATDLITEAAKIAESLDNVNRSMAEISSSSVNGLDR